MALPSRILKNEYGGWNWDGVRGSRNKNGHSDLNPLMWPTKSFSCMAKFIWRISQSRRSSAFAGILPSFCTRRCIDLKKVQPLSISILADRNSSKTAPSVPPKTDVVDDAADVSESDADTLFFGILSFWVDRR